MDTVMIDRVLARAERFKTLFADYDERLSYHHFSFVQPPPRHIRSPLVKLTNSLPSTAIIPSNTGIASNLCSDIRFPSFLETACRSPPTLPFQMSA